MPLSCYKNKSNELWRYVESMELADPKMFDDADITNNLCICTLMNETVDKFKTYYDMSKVVIDKNCMAFFNKQKTETTYFKYVGLIWDTPEYNPDPQTWVAHGVRILGDGNHRNGYDVEWNTGVNIDKRNISSIRENGKYRYNVFFTVMPSKKAKDNYVTFMYNHDPRSNLQYRLVKALNSTSGSPFPAIPQIDWEAISDTPLWKEGKYDEAVLDVMGLKWDGDVIVEERKL